MDHKRGNAQRGDRGRGRGTGGRNQPNSFFQGLQKTLPPKDSPEVQVPKWASERFEAWAPQLKSAIGDGQSVEAIRKMMDQLLSRSINPYWTAIQVATWCMEQVSKAEQTAKEPTTEDSEKAATEPNSQVAKKAAKENPQVIENVVKALPLTVMKALSDRLSGGHRKPPALDVDIKIYTFSRVLEKSNYEFFQEVSKLYQFKSNPEVLLGSIHKALAENKYGAVARAVGLLALQSRFKITEILFPLVMLNKLNTVFRYLDSASTDAPTDLVQFLDALLEEKWQVIIDLVNRLEIPEVKKEHLSKKQIGRCCIRLAEKYKVPQEFWKTARYEKLQSVLMFLIMKRYADQSIPEEDWEEILCGFVKGNRKLGRVAVIRMAFKDDLDGAARCARRWGIEVSALPVLVKDALRSGRPIPYDERREEEKRKEQRPKPPIFYPSDQIPMAPIQIVNSRSSFDYFIAMIKKAKMVGMDSEWRPVFLDDKPKVALLQLATEDRVYLLDILALQRDPLMAGKWADMKTHLFANENILKIGFSLNGDWNGIEAIDSSLKGLEERLVNVLDLRVLCRDESFIFSLSYLLVQLLPIPNVLKNHPEVFPFYDGTPPEHKGLTNYVELCFGAPLNKHQQFSNWEKRPLRYSQVKYAALDASCLLDIYETMKSRCLKANLDFDALCIKEKKLELPKEDVEDSDDE